MCEEIVIALRTDQHFVKVEAISDLEYLVKESEMLTRRPGRVFHIRSQDRPILIALECGGFVIRSLRPNVVCKTLFLPRRLLLDAMLGHALKSGMLFTRRLAG